MYKNVSETSAAISKANLVKCDNESKPNCHGTCKAVFLSAQLSVKASYIISIQRQYLFESDSSLTLPTIMKGPLWTNCHIVVWICLKQCILDWLSVILCLCNRISIGLFQWKIITFKVLLKENSKSKWGHTKWNFEIIISIKKAMVVMYLLYC